MRQMNLHFGRVRARADIPEAHRIAFASRPFLHLSPRIIYSALFFRPFVPRSAPSVSFSSQLGPLLTLSLSHGRYVVCTFLPFCRLLLLLLLLLLLPPHCFSLAVIRGILLPPSGTGDKLGPSVAVRTRPPPTPSVFHAHSSLAHSLKAFAIAGLTHESPHF